MRNIFLFLLLAQSLLSVAQIKKSEQTIGWQGNNIELHSISDKSGQRIFSILMNEGSMKCYLLDSSMQLKEPFFLPRKPKERLWGGFFRGSKVYLFLDNGEDAGLHSWVIDVATGDGADRTIDFDTKREKIIDRISCGDHFLYFTVDKKNSEFVIYDFNNDSSYTLTRHRFEDGLWKELTSAYGIGRTLNVEKIDLEGDCSIDAAACPNKVYARNDSLYLLINREKGTTRIFTFDLATQRVSSRSIIHAVPAKNQYGAGYMTDNSFLLGDKLYYVRATPDSLAVQMLNFHSAEVIKTYAVAREEDISFRNTPVVQEGSSTIYAANMVRDLDKTRQLLRKMLNGDALIMADRNGKGQVELAVGSYKKLTQSNGGMWMPSAVPGTPPMVYVPTGGFYRNNWTKSARFKMLLDEHSAAHIEGEMRPSVSERIEEYTKGIKIPADAENLFSCEGVYYYAYYDKRGRKLCIVQF